MDNSLFVIFGASKNGVRVFKEISKNKNIVAFCDNSPKKKGLELMGCPIWGVEEVAKLSATKMVYIILASWNYMDEMVEQLRDLAFQGRIFGLPLQYFEDEKIISDQVWYEIELSKRMLPYIEYHVAWNCNLKCKKCGHCSNIQAAPRMGNLEQFQKDLIRLKELFWNIKDIRLMGGEPLLNKKLAAFISISAEIFPGARISVVTNGLLIPSAETELFEVMNSFGVWFAISQYPPTAEVKELIELICWENDLKYNFTPLIDQFWEGMDVTGSQAAVENYASCTEIFEGKRRCHFLCDGKISMCTLTMIAKEYDFPFFEQIKDDVIDIYDTKWTGESLLQKLQAPNSTCRFCKPLDRELFRWEGHSSETFEWK